MPTTIITSTTGRTRGEYTPKVGAQVPELKLDKRIGEGHSAQVLVAHEVTKQAGAARELVVKVARQDESPARMKKLMSELQQEQRTSVEFSAIDPAFVRLFSAGELKMGKHKMPAAVMEKVEGAPLADWRKGGVKRTPAVAAALVAKLTDVLAKLERAGYRHNDLHTENLFAVNDDPATLRIIDLGRASKLTDKTKGTRIVFGAPERRAGGGTTGVASDIYTVGIVLFTLLAGHAPPMNPKQPTAAVDPAVLARLTGSLDASEAGRAQLLSVLQRALAEKPSARFASFAEFHAALRGLT